MIRNFQMMTFNNQEELYSDIVGLKAYTNQEFLDKGKQSGCKDIYSKPLTFFNLKKIVLKHVYKLTEQ